MGNTQLGNLGYDYDADGHVTAKTGSLAATGMPASVSGNTFDANNAMTGFNGATLTYDANGNLTGDGTNTYTWDARNHLSAISGAATASFVYDALGRRMSKTINGPTTQFLYDGLNPVQELQSGTPSANLLTGLNIDEYFTRTDSSGSTALLTDALGSTIGLTNSAGALATNYTYQPFGATTTSGTANANSYQFTGRENDGTGLYYYRARYYDSIVDRFISGDPVLRIGAQLISFLLRPGVSASQRINAYVYALNDPNLFTDPYGLDECIGVWLEIASVDIAAPLGDPQTGGGGGPCLCFWGCLACNGSIDLYNNDYDRPATQGFNIETSRGPVCFAAPPDNQTGCSNFSSGDQ